MMRTYAWTLVALLLVVGCGKSESEDSDNNENKNGDGVTIDQSTPQKAVESFKAAAKAKDGRKMFACITEESKPQLLFISVMTATFSTIRDEDKQKALQEIMKKHGVDPKLKLTSGIDAMADAKDKDSLYGELKTWWEENKLEPKAGARTRTLILEQLAAIELSNYEIEDDRAFADMTMAGKTKTRSPLFKKIDGKWYIDIVGGLKIKKPRIGPRFPKKTTG